MKHHYPYDDEPVENTSFCPSCGFGHDGPCRDHNCSRPHGHVFTDAELRAMQERLIRAAWRMRPAFPFDIPEGGPFIQRIIAAAEAAS